MAAGDEGRTNWNVKTLGEVATLVAGAGFPLTFQGQTGKELPFFKVGNLAEVESGEELRTSKHSISRAEAADLGAKVVPRGATVFAKIGMAIDLNRRRLLGQPSCIDNNLMAAVPNVDVIDERYLMRFLETLEFMELSHATTVPALRKSDLERLPIPVPSIAEQRAVADSIDSLNATCSSALDHLVKARGALEHLRTSVLAAAYREAGTPENGDGQLPLEQILREPLRNGYSARPVNHSTPFRVLTLTATTSGWFNPKHFKYTDEKFSGGSPFWLQPGDIVVQRGNTEEFVGVPAVYEGKPNEFLYPDLMIRVRVRSDIAPRFVWYMLLAPQARNSLRSRSTGSAGNMPKINQAILASVPIPLPRLSSREAIVSKLDAVFRLADRVTRRLELAAQLIDSGVQAAIARAFRSGLTDSKVA